MSKGRNVNDTLSLVDDSVDEIERAYRDQGFVVLSGLIDQATIDRIKSQIQTLLETEANRHLEEVFSDDRFDGAFTRLFNMKDDYRHNLYETLQDVSGLYSVVDHDSVQEMLRILDIRVPALRDIGMRMDQPEEEEHLQPLHQDVFPMRAENCLNFWIPMQDMTNQNGALRVFPGSHEIGPVPKSKKRLNEHGHQSIPETVVQEYDDVLATIDLGDALVFHPYLVHGSTSNLSDNVRWTITVRFDDATDMEWMIDGENPYLDLRLDEVK